MLLVCNIDGGFVLSHGAFTERHRHVWTEQGFGEDDWGGWKHIRCVSMLYFYRSAPPLILFQIIYVYLDKENCLLIYQRVFLTDCPPAVQLTWMAYDMVTLRTGFEMEGCMRELEEAYSRCRAAVFGEPEPQAQMEAGAKNADSSQS